MEPTRIEPSVRRRLRGVTWTLDTLLGAAALAAVAALVLEYGFREPVVELRILRLVELVIVAVFVLDRFARLALAPDRPAYFRHNIVDFVLMALAAIVMIVQHEAVLSLGTLYVLITQAYILIVLLLRGVSLNLRFAEIGIHPSWLLVGSFALLILGGSGLLMLPVAVHEQYYSNWHYDDALFTSTSAVCVTGLVVRNTGAHFTGFGQTVVLLLIQAGGLGIMLFGTVLGLLVGKALSMRQSSTIGRMISTEGIGSLARVASFVILITLMLEAVGAVLLYPMFAGSFDTAGRPLEMLGAAWHAVFHSVSAFCNAGFALYGESFMTGSRGSWSAGPLRDHWQIIGVIAPLIILGGVGFPVLQDCAGWTLRQVRRLAVRLRRHQAVVAHLPPQRRLTLHSRVVLTVSLILILGGAGVLLLLEGDGGAGRGERVGLHPVGRYDAPASDWATMSWPQRVRASLFQSITARTAGFNTVNMAEMSDGSKLWMCVLMTIGGSPASTAGGVKTVTVAMLVLVAWCQLRRRKEIEVFRRSISLTVIGRAVTIAMLYLGLLTTVTIALCAVQGPGFRFIDLLFESASACGTVGLSTGVTPDLSLPGKFVIIAGMFIGRLGPLTLLAGLTSRLRHVDFTYPTESVIIG